ncbi:NADPH-dependent F420 reductase [Flavobacterium sp. RSSB_23]|uniref:NADPH-dependent F420 reductase n=1 Tax=Flavobacterium sp. RSSB_23 TaxID=3447668 RepID=UPI003F3DB5CD
MTTTSKVAVIGLGNIGKTITQNLIKSNRPVIVATRQLEEAIAFSQELGNLVTPAETREAIQQADIIVLSVWFHTIIEFLEQYREELKGKIIIDPSNPIAPDDKGGFKKIIGEKESAGELLAAILPQDAILVKALGTLGVASLANAAFASPEKSVLFYATNDSAVDGVVAQLLQDTGFEALKVGGLNQSIRIEVFGDLHEFGAIGKPVSVAEAQTKI